MKEVSLGVLFLLFSYTLVFSQPAVLGITRHSPVANPVVANSVTFRVNFSVPVTGVDVNDFTLTRGGGVNGDLSLIAQNEVGTFASIYHVSVSSITGLGTLRLDINSSGTGITNATGELLNDGFTAGETYAIRQGDAKPVFGFTLPLEPVNLSLPTKDKPQAKVWFHANQWWCVLSATAGTSVFRLDGNAWTNILTLTTRSSKPDCLTAGNLVHILAYRGALGNSLFYSLEYDKITNRYKPWSQQPAGISLVFPVTSETATIAIDGKNRIWAASVGGGELVFVWSDPPYKTWSQPTILASGLKVDDICAITSIPNKSMIAVFWSNQNTRRFGFKTHSDASGAETWSTDETPAASYANDSVGRGLADDHMNIHVASDGTLYCATKTGYNRPGYPKIILLVRRPSGVWDPPYTVTINPDGTQPLLLLDEIAGKLKIVYSSAENGGNLMVSESATSNISFGKPYVLIEKSNALYDYATSTHQQYNSEIVILATEINGGVQRAIGLLAFDNTSMPEVKYPDFLAVPAATPILMENDNFIELNAYPNPFNSKANINFRLKEASNYTISIYDVRGRRVLQIAAGRAEAGKEYTMRFNGFSLAPGMYNLNIMAGSNSKNIKLVQLKN